MTILDEYETGEKKKWSPLYSIYGRRFFYFFVFILFSMLHELGYIAIQNLLSLAFLFYTRTTSLLQCVRVIVATQRAL